MLIIGEKINGSIPSVKKLVENYAGNQLVALARQQAEAGADFIDINVATGSGSRTDEIKTMQWAVTTLQTNLQTPLCVDSADPAVLEAGLSALNGQACMINSTSAERGRLERIVPLALSFDAQLVALPIDDNGIPQNVTDRLKICATIVETCMRFGFPVEKLLFDPLVLPLATDNRQGSITLNTLAEIKSAFPEVKTVMGLSNVSFGLPRRKKLNQALLYMAVHAGLDAVIADPLDEDLMAAIKAAEAVAGLDRHCRRYIRASRNKT